MMMINLGNPDLAFGLSFLPADGVGLARMEFIISEYIKVIITIHLAVLCCFVEFRSDPSDGAHPS
jgi:phosphoenolpyruvate synthase/pyruvate phosphate dikinase